MSPCALWRSTDALMNAVPSAPLSPSPSAHGDLKPPAIRAVFELADSLATAPALQARWMARAPHQPGLLLIDPSARWAQEILAALTDATGAEPERIRVLSAAGLRETATIDELHLPALPGRPDVVRHLRVRRLDPSAPSPALECLWRHTALAVLLVGNLDDEAASRWVLSACALSRKLGDAGPRWAVFMRAGADRELPADLQATWLGRMRFLTQPGALQHQGTAASIWNAVFRAWVTEPRG